MNFYLSIFYFRYCRNLGDFKQSHNDMMLYVFKTDSSVVDRGWYLNFKTPSG